MKQIIIAILTWLFIQQTDAQTLGRIHLTIKDQASEPLTYHLMLKKQTDSSVYKIDMANSNQAFVFEEIDYGQYFIEVYYLQNKLLTTQPILLNQADLTLADLLIQEKQRSLKDVKITAGRPLLERKNDKLIYNVENTISSPTDDALSVLQKAPGLMVDQNGQLSMRGKSGVMIMINGKPTYLSGEQLNTLLKGTMANQISKIEIITNPSSKYDANGNAGIVNIILKKDQRQGSNASLTLSYGSGKYRKSNQGLSLNHRNKKLNAFMSYNFVHNIGMNDLSLYRKFYNDGVYQGAYEQHNYLRSPAFYHLPKLGVDYTLNEKTMIGILLTGFSHQYNSNADNFTYIENNLFQRQSYYTTTNRSNDHWYHGGINLNYKHSFDSLGRELTADVDYLRYGNTTEQHFATHYYNLQHQALKNPYLLLGQVNGNLSIKSIKADYIQPLKHQFKLECGIKSSLVEANNKLSFYDESYGGSTFDSNQSNHFIYQENINALYSNISVEKNNFSVQLGVRAEQTVAHGLQVIHQTTFNRNYWQLFPTFFITHQFNKTHQTGFSFSRRILRPTYQQLNPFKFFIDASTFHEGNPYLQPQNTYLFELNHTYHQQVQFTWSTGITNKSITEVLIPAEGQNNITIQTNKNVNKQYVHSLSGSTPFSIKKWWKGMFDATVYYSLYDGVLASQQIHSGTFSWNAKTSQTINLPKQFVLQIDGFIQYAEHYSFYSNSAFGALNCAIQKSLFNKKLTIKFTANDIFYQTPIRGSSHFENYHEDFYVKRDSRTFILAMTYRFGNNTLPGSRRRTVGAEEEKQRAG